MDEEFRRLMWKIYRKVWEIRREIEETSESYFSRVTWPIPRGAIEPLHSMYEFPDEYVVIVDIPEADSSTVTVLVKGEYMEVKARIMSTELLERYGAVQRREEEITYVKRILLPPDADVASIEYKFSRGRLIIRLPKKLPF